MSSRHAAAVTFMRDTVPVRAALGGSDLILWRSSRPRRAGGPRLCPSSSTASPAATSAGWHTRRPPEGSIAYTRGQCCHRAHGRAPGAAARVRMHTKTRACRRREVQLTLCSSSSLSTTLDGSAATRAMSATCAGCTAMTCSAPPASSAGSREMLQPWADSDSGWLAAARTRLRRTPRQVGAVLAVE